MSQPVKAILSAKDHNRDVAGFTYVYPVYSRRARGLSVGINLNPNNACNWRCIYCQVPNLVRGGAPAIDLELLNKELRALLHDVLHTTFLADRLPAEAQRINDIALSGNGEPTSAKSFDAVIETLISAMTDFNLLGKIKLLLITNGSLVQRPVVKRGLQLMAKNKGEVWFKLDSATNQGMRGINGSELGIRKVYQNLVCTAQLCPTWLQTCIFQRDGAHPSEHERQAYLNFIEKLVAARVPLRGALIYGLARPSMQPQAASLKSAELKWLQNFASDIQARGLPAEVHA